MDFLIHVLGFSVACTFHHLLLRGSGAFCPGDLGDTEVPSEDVVLYCT